MNSNNLSLDQAPSIETPLRFFITAPVFLILASLLLLIQGPDILQNRWLPQTLALTHLITLGFISMVMIGALFQLLPVLAGCHIPQARRISFLVHSLYTSGVIFLVTGFLSADNLYYSLAFLLITPALIIFLGAISISLIKSTSAIPSSHGIKFSIVSLCVAILLALMLLSSYAFPEIPLLRQYTELHIAWAMLGWMTLLVISVAYQVIPMFQITTEYPNLIKRYFVIYIFISLLLWSLFRLYELHTGESLQWLIYCIIVTCSLALLIFIHSSIRLLLQRKKRMADTSLYFWVTSLLSLASCLLMYLFAELTQLNLSIATGILFFAGFAMSVINGMLYKIVPFLLWLHLHRKLSLAGKRLSGIPTIYEIISHKKGRRQFFIHLLALLTTLSALPYPTLFFYPASLLWLLSGTLLCTHLLQAIYGCRLFLNSSK